MPCAGTMAFHRDLPSTTRIWVPSEDQQKTGYSSTLTVAVRIRNIKPVTRRRRRVGVHISTQQTKVSLCCTDANRPWRTPRRIMFDRRRRREALTHEKAAKTQRGPAASRDPHCSCGLRNQYKTKISTYFRTHLSKTRYNNTMHPNSK